MRNLRYISLFILLLVIGSCSRKQKTQEDSSKFQRRLPEYATRFSFGQFKGFDVIFLHNPWQPDKVEHQVLCVPRDEKIPSDSNNFKIIRTPLKKMVSMSGTQIASIAIINELSSIKGVGDKNLVKQPYLKKRLKNGKVRQTGSNGNFNYEGLMALDPELILVSPFKGKTYEKLTELGMVILPYADYMERHPLGRAEWIKLMGMLYEKEEAANSYFRDVRRRYQQTKSLAGEVNHHPTVFSGKPYGGVWYMPGGESYMAHFFKDAGANYLWKDNQQAASMSLDFETVYAIAARADFWKLVVKSDKPYSYDRLLAEDERYADFRAFKKRNLLVCNVAKTSYYEKGALEPDIILADFIKAFHPELLQDHQPKYFKILRN